MRIASGVLVLLLVTLAAGADAHGTKPSNDASETDQQVVERFRRSLAGKKAATTNGNANGNANAARPLDIAGMTRVAEGHLKSVNTRRKAKALGEEKGLRSMLGHKIKKSDMMAKMRKAFAQSGVEQTAATLMRSKSATAVDHDGEDAEVRSKGLSDGLSTAIKDAFIAYDTDARRNKLQLPALQGTDDQKSKCKSLGWALVELYMDILTGEEVVYNEGCSEEDLWMTGIGYEDPNDYTKSVCQKWARTADLAIDWSKDIETVSCWGSAQFTDYCSANIDAKCNMNGTKGRGTATTGAKSWFTGASTTGGSGACSLLVCFRALYADADSRH